MKFMKKKIFGALVVVAIAAGAMMNVNINKVSNKGDLALANVEALADGETVSLPCCSCAPCLCTVSVKLQDGTTGTMTVNQSKNC